MNTIYPNMYILLVGPSGCGKGIAMSPGMELIESIGIRLAAEAITREALIRELKTSDYTDVAPDGTTHFHCSLTVFSAEFTVFLGFSNTTLMSDLCDWYDCRKRWIYRTKNSGTDEIHGVWVNVLGGTTPKLIQTALPQDAIGSGLTARIIIIFEEDNPKIEIFPSFDQKVKDALLHDLERINMMAGEYKVTDDFLKLWGTWYPSDGKSRPFNDERFDGYSNRRALHIRKLSMVCAASRRDELIMDRDDLMRAITMLHGAERNMNKVFAGVGKSIVSDTTNEVLRFICSVGKCTREQLMNHFYHDADVDTMDRRILSTLVSMKQIEVVRTQSDTIVRYIGDIHRPVKIFGGEK